MTADAKRARAIYWTITLLVLLPTALSGVVELFTNGPEAVIQSFKTLGYPLYLMRILGFAKILGAIAILSERSRTLKEWAYAGFTFDFLGATASHVFVRDYTHAPAPFVMFLILMASFRMWHQSHHPHGVHPTSQPHP